MRTLFIFILLAVSQLGFSQQKNEVGFFIAPISQSAIEYSGNNLNRDYQAKNSLSLETGLFFTRVLNKKFAIQPNLNFGIAYSNLTPNDPNYVGINNADEIMYWFSFIPKLEYNILNNSKKLQLVSGVGVRHFFDVIAGGSSAFGYTGFNNPLIEQRDFSTGTYSNPIANEKKWQWYGEIGITYNANLYKNRIFLKINPFYQPAFSDAYTGVYKYTKGTDIETGTYKGKLNQSGVRILFSYKF